MKATSVNYGKPETYQRIVSLYGITDTNRIDGTYLIRYTAYITSSPSTIVTLKNKKKEDRDICLAMENPYNPRFKEKKEEFLYRNPNESLTNRNCSNACVEHT